MNLLENSVERRKRLDHERYIRNRDKRLKSQREYYQRNIEWCRKYYKRRAEIEKRAYNLNKGD